jgi:hypothetical protein
MKNYKFDPNLESTKILIEKFKSLYRSSIEQQNATSLSIEHLKAIFKKVINESLETAMNNQKVPIEERDKIVSAFENLIHEECPEMQFDSKFIFSDDGFFKKDLNVYNNILKRVRAIRGTFKQPIHLAFCDF